MQTIGLIIAVPVVVAGMIIILGALKVVFDSARAWVKGNRKQKYHLLPGKKYRLEYYISSNEGGGCRIQLMQHIDTEWVDIILSEDELFSIDEKADGFAIRILNDGKVHKVDTVIREMILRPGMGEK
jgi:hypothetical protein